MTPLQSLVKNGPFYPGGKNGGIGMRKVLGMGKNGVKRLRG